MSHLAHPADPDPPVELPSGPAALLPYAGASGLTAAVMAVLVVVVGLPLTPVLQVGLTFLGVAMVVRRLEDVPPDAGSGVVAWTAEQLRRLSDDYGVEFYGVASLATFLRAEALSLLETDLSLADLLASPLGTVIRWMVTEFIESLLNGIWAALWWIQLLQAVPGLLHFVGVVAAGWGIWRVLDIAPREVDPLAGLADDLGDLGELDELTRDL